MENALPQIMVTKSDGRIVPFDPNKIIKVLRKVGADERAITLVLQQTYKVLYEGISTKKIYESVFGNLKRMDKSLAGRYNLKKAIFALGPSGFPFEKYVGSLFIAEGYTVKTGITVSGKCVDHEVDVVAENTFELNMMECKFHSTQKSYCSVQHSLYVRARFWDIEREFEQDDASLPRKFSGWLVTNTRFSTDAITYGTCSDLKMMSWDFPLNSSLKDRIDKLGLHPVTSIVSLSQREKRKLLAMNIVLCQSLNAEILGDLGISESRIPNIIWESASLCRRNKKSNID
ncbi:ATP cone domain-containing protein [Albibacterium bauzanense]|uniref:ATP cone domain-containing protein n=1 Tax=Albibacterium bauzanense TaxID=653929 RepID=A0A4R1LRQ6_9SPHI|nr:ATP cone domain-containing protein [Albibacterium bauzanense]TCK80920.1 ATP cone domain-containing protein [Albibacterium bauzanense]